MLLRYRGSEGMLAWAFHRISGVAIWLFILLHVLDIWLAGVDPQLYDDVCRSTRARSAGSLERSSARRSCTTRSTACGSSSWTSGPR